MNYNHTVVTNTMTLARWLFVCCAMVYAMVIIGAITRLTESGLSITEWRPLIGALPPLNDAQWQHVFDLYKQTPEFQKKNFWMGIDEFKTIFFWEWFHRLWGRLIGVVYALPLLWFWARGMIPRGWGWPFIGLLALGGLQGFMGWYMVKSGLVDVPAVSHYRLAAHLSLAFVIFSVMLWMGLKLMGYPRRPDRPLFLHAMGVMTVLCITIVWGAFTAGLDAGLIYNDSFPKMGGQWIPAEIINDRGWFYNVIETHAGVQFAHRWLAILTVCGVLSLWLHGARRDLLSPTLNAAALMSLVQMSLGIITLLSVVWLPVAVLHQAGALILLAILVIMLYRFKSA